MRGAAAITALFLLSGCTHWFGPTDGVFYVVGSTPGGAPCQLSVAAVGAAGHPKDWTVSGDFRESVLINPSRNGHRILLSCDNTVVAARTLKYGHDVEIGGVLMINDSAP